MSATLRKSVRIRSYSGPYFHAFGLNTERYELSLRIPSECEKIRTRITPNTDTFHAVQAFENSFLQELPHTTAFNFETNEMKSNVNINLIIQSRKQTHYLF